MRISDYLSANTIFPDLKSNNKEQVIQEIASGITKVNPNINEDRLIEVLMERERLCSTALDSGVAVPHGKLSGITDIILGFGKSSEGISYESLDNKPTHFLFTLIAPEDSISIHIRLLARISKIFKNPELRSRLSICKTAQEIYQAIISEDEKYS